ncbi:pTP [Murine mastadenovirus A]|uniref:pTP n=1 Tax=Murine mastadenovirus A TaxID=129956 RepID=UPI00001D96C5|nr:pTP [Murine mastadenovirus A]
MAQISPLDCARLTGQRIYTMEVFRPLRNIWNRIGALPPVAVSAPGVTWLSRFVYNYPQLMLLDLAPRAPATRHWPLYSYPPPHFLVGYEYVVRAFNDYEFDTRTYSRITYLETRRQGIQLLDWLCLATASYTINISAYRRFLNVDDEDADMGERFLAIQRSILADRIIADFGLQHRARMEGLGLPDGNSPVPVPLRHLMRHCQPSSWGFAQFCRSPPPAQPPEEEGQSAENAATLLSLIARIRSAYFLFLLHALTLAPETDLPPDAFARTLWSLPVNSQNWLSSWFEFYSNDQVDLSELLGHLPLRQILPLLMDCLSLPSPSPSLPPAGLLAGGAILRPREDGRAVTASMLRRRGEAVVNFIESLPIPTRRRRPRPPPSPPSPLQDDEEEEAVDFVQAIRAAVQESIEILQEELTDHARQQNFFTFALRFYATLENLIDEDMINEASLHRWIMYFFTTEHVATTLNYLHYQLNHRLMAQRHLNLELSQIILRARDVQGTLVFSRVFSELGYDSMTAVMQRLVRELTASIPHAGRQNIEQGEIEHLMDAIDHPEDSGDITDILQQIEANDNDIDSMELSFRFRLSGPVVFTGNQRIQTLTRRVSQEATRLRQQRRPMPMHNQAHVLPPEDVPERRRL